MENVADRMVVDQMPELALAARGDHDEVVGALLDLVDGRRTRGPQLIFVRMSTPSPILATMSSRRSRASRSGCSCSSRSAPVSGTGPTPPRSPGDTASGTTANSVN
jgi:hypothetical protein